MSGRWRALLTMSYSFYCSKCKVDHAGECPTPPDCSPPVAYKQIVFNVQTIRPIGMALNPPPYPIVMSEWEVENQVVDPNTGVRNWVRTGRRYRVKSINPGASSVEVESLAAPLLAYKMSIDVSAWSAGGYAGFTTRYRMVPVMSQKQAGGLVVGSWWTAETRTSVTDPWAPSVQGEVFEVVRVSTNSVKVKLVGSGATYDFSHEAWDADGVIPYPGYHARLVAHPNIQLSP